jgi:histidinol dehydrogenase
MLLRLVSASDAAALARIVSPPAERGREVARRAAAIVADVRRNGDAALARWARRLDGHTGPMEVPLDDIRAGARRTPAGVRQAIRLAAANIRAVARRQVPRSSRVRVAPGVVVEQRVMPLARVGCYVPGGRYPLPSSLLMTAIPARVAGVGDIVAVCPRPEPPVLAAALEAGVTRLFRLGGAQAIAALAFGTASVPRVDKIVGPGNAYVAAAKALVAPECAIDFFAGPSEIVVVSGSGDPAWIAADLMAQAEHDPDARAIFVTWRRDLARRVIREVESRAAPDGPMREALAANGGVILTRDREHAIEIADRILPEHLVCDDEEVARRVRSGATFVGPWTVQAAGDYAIGSNHVLPTGGAARFRGGLTAADFVRVCSVQRLTRAGLARLAPAVTALAEAEGLPAHAWSLRVRLS